MGFGALVWDPDRIFFIVPYIHHPVTWYGLLFACGFFVGYLLIKKMFTQFLKGPNCSEREAKLIALKLTDQLTFLSVFGTIIGARLGHVFFYGWSYYSQHLVDIFKVWEGGLASHGGAVGVLIGVILFIWWNRREYKQVTFLTLLDVLVVAAAFAGGCIRIGNFINQEITGVPTTHSWGVVFLHPIDGIAGVPLHPVQLYESAAYFAVFVFLYLLWRMRMHLLGRGILSGWFFVLVFGFRFGVEFLKTPQSEWLDAYSSITMGQLLSVPFLFFGLFLLIYSHFKRKQHALSSP